MTYHGCLARGRIKSEPAPGKNRSVMKTRPSQQGAQTSFQFIEIERLHKIIVSSRVEATQPVTETIPRCYDKRGDAVRSACMHPREQLQPAHFGQPAINASCVV